MSKALIGQSMRRSIAGATEEYIESVLFAQVVRVP